MIEHMIAADIRTGVVIETGEPLTPPPPTLEDYSNAVQTHVDTVARGRDYRHGDAMAGHVTDPRPQWAAEAQAFVNWRSDVWAYVYALWADPPDPPPSPAELVASLPEIVWPEVQA